MENTFNKYINNSGDGVEMATPSQKSALVKLGYKGNIEQLTKAQASAEITRINESRVNQNKQNAPGPIYQPQPAQNQYQAPTQYNNSPVAQEVAQALPDMFQHIGQDVAATLSDLIKADQLFIPEGYSIGNALKSAIFKIQTSDQASKLLACDPNSIAQALTEYVVQGLDASRNQAYFIPFGGKMTMLRSYFGDVSVAISTGLVKEVFANVILQGDEIETGFDIMGHEVLTMHKRVPFEKRDNPIVGAYAVVRMTDDSLMYEFMTMEQIRKSWSQTKSTDKNKLQQNFQTEACKRTVIRRAVKMVFNTSLCTSVKQAYLIGSFNRTTANEYDDAIDVDLQQQQEYNQRQQTASIKPNFSGPVYQYQAPNVEQEASAENDNDWMNE